MLPEGELRGGGPDKVGVDGLHDSAASLSRLPVPQSPRLQRASCRKRHIDVLVAETLTTTHVVRSHRFPRASRYHELVRNKQQHDQRIQSLRKVDSQDRRSMRLHQSNYPSRFLLTEIHDETFTSSPTLAARI